MLNSIGNLLKDNRVGRKLTIKELSKLLDIPTCMISKLEKGTNFNKVYLYRLCNYYNLDYEEILNKKWDLDCNEFINNRGQYVRN